jgi:hypothetical protein
MATGALRPHIFLQNTSRIEHFTAPSMGGGSPTVVPPQNRQMHAAELRQQFAQVEVAQQALIAQQQQANVQTAIGVQVEFESMHGVKMAAESLARDHSGIELMNVRKVGDQVFATVFVPDGKILHFENLLVDYVAERKNSLQRPMDNQKLVDAIRSVRVATFDAVWTDSTEVLPTDDQQAIWWEVWLPAGQHRQQSIDDFRHLASLAGMQTRERALFFPERSVITLHGTKAQLLQAPLLLNSIAELRRAKDTAAFFDSLDSHEQAEWVSELQSRLSAGNIETDSLYVTLLDTGVNNGHPLLAPFVASADLHSVEPAWGAADADGHGTELAGLALLGDLGLALADGMPLLIAHRLESVKVLQHAGGNQGESYGDLTIEAVGRVEISAANRRRIFSMSVTADDGRDRGRPSSWSAVIDRLASDYEYQGATPRLFFLSAGNTQDTAAWAEHPASLATNGIQDPSQAWNAITIGAYSQLTNITEPNMAHYQAIAAVDDLSPFTTTSCTWSSDWPFKPDIVMEGGNAAIEPGGFTSTASSLSLLTTHCEPLLRSFTTTHATSAATALATKLGAEIGVAYPSFWPETVRAVMVHSARWTPKMLEQYLGHQKSRASLTNLLRHCGYGVPNVQRALWSASNSLTLIVQDQLQPYEKVRSAIKTRDMHLHALPWPTDILEGLGNTNVTLRVTLSYFIEPNPGDRGAANKYAYQSHALRFAVRRPLENEAIFRARINAGARDEENGLPVQTVGDAGWFIGETLRRRGSLLSDTWTGSAAELANRGQIAIYPTMGWWRNRPALARHEQTARYALLVSIEAPEVVQDLYAAVEQEIQQALVVPIAAS